MTDLENEIEQLKQEIHNLREKNHWLGKDAKTLAQTLLKVSPEHRGWLETNFGEYL